ncbi:MAG: hypothetical protein HYY81_04820, partial [Deltaproteobacteria bacterium]|nr:hypothetical protein [Deltaproteobacteria bacterium]
MGERRFRRFFLRFFKRALVSLTFLGVVGFGGSLIHAQEEEAEPVPSTPSSPQVTPPSRPPERRKVPPPARADLVSLNFSRAELVEVIHVLAQHLKLNYTIDPEVKGTVTIHSAEPLTKEALLPIFHQLLRVNGAVAV